MSDRGSKINLSSYDTRSFFLAFGKEKIVCTAHIPPRVLSNRNYSQERKKVAVGVVYD
jgi:hypothetical protein